MISRLLAFAAAALLAGSATLERQKAFDLPPLLREVSGLAPSGADAVFAHADEYAIIHEISLASGAVRRSFAFGKPTLKGDFEGVANVAGTIWLVTADGRLVEGRAGAHGERTRVNIYDTGVGGACEIEGLAASSDPARFFLLCKNILKGPRDRLKVFEWSLKDRLARPRLAVDVGLRGLIPEGRIEAFRPSDLVRDAASGHFLILDASGSLLETTSAGARVRFIALDRKLHPQPEGLAVMPDGRILIADEGVRRAGTLAIYRMKE